MRAPRTNRSVATLVWRQGLRMTLGGLAVGLVLGALFARSLSALLFGVESTDPPGALGGRRAAQRRRRGFGVAAARRAARVDPLVAMRTTT
jgi:hypothetical protein